ncbi:RING-type E3 ubiquitin transferase [Hyphodiscus hymeniophilus]|uniref:RING-type E3 ubiquitin transferase n=1 Tax=Hyphodiscus hymeniophilus TaxID=353542 RepID=A0A9P6VPT7_9HELO|nr:RING-type E3 ubiquitin transferase [Hyphodiscus hymeniophilus]
MVKLKIPSKELQAFPHPTTQIPTQPVTKANISGLVAKKRKPVGDGRDIQTNSAPTQSNQKRIKPTPDSGASAQHLSKSESDKENIVTVVARSRPIAKSEATEGQGKQQMTIEAGRNAPEWYADVEAKQKPVRGDLQRIAHVKTLIANCVAAVKEQKNQEARFTELRDKIHEMEFYPILSQLLIKKSKVLDSEGLSQIFDGANEDIFPWDIKSDAEYLWRRWMAGDIDGDLMRGIEISKSDKRTLYKLKTTYVHKKKSSNAVGENGLMNGQWWPNRICAWRDGAHGEQEAGIHGQTGSGAFSVVVSAAGYDDKDNGEVIEYCGTKSHDSTPTKSTSLMLDSLAKDKPLRVLRAANKKSKYAPEEGIRYDGLYQIMAKEILDPSKAMYRFTLKRIEQQDPIRWSGVEKRPTRQELMERMVIRRLLL